MSCTYLYTDTQIEPIIDKYINMIDDYDFHSLLNSLVDDEKRDTYIKELKAIDDGNSLAISTIMSKGIFIYRDIIQRCIEVDGFEDVVHNYLSRHDENVELNMTNLSQIPPFANTEVDSCSIHAASIPCDFFSRMNFNCDVHISSTVIGVGCFYRSKFNGHSVYIEEGCEVLNNNVFYWADGIDTIYLPSTLTYLGYIFFDICATYTKINYNSTVDNFIELIKESCWTRSSLMYESAKVIDADIICTDGVIKKGQRFDSNYNMI